jgi:hypothetical protein
MVKVAETHVFLKKPSSCNMNYHSLVDAVKVTTSYKTSCSRGKNRESIENKEGWKRRDRVVLKMRMAYFVTQNLNTKLTCFLGRKEYKSPDRNRYTKKEGDNIQTSFSLTDHSCPIWMGRTRHVFNLQHISYLPLPTDSILVVRFSTSPVELNGRPCLHLTQFPSAAPPPARQACHLVALF